MARVNKFSLTNILKKAQLNFKSSNQGLLGNKYFENWGFNPPK